MDPRLNERERAVRDAARAALEGAVGAAVAAAIDESLEVPGEVLAALGGASVLGSCIPTEHGGGGGGLTELALVVEEVGRASASLASVVAGHLVAGLLIAAGGEGPAGMWLPDLACGKRLATVGLGGGRSIFDDPGPAARLGRAGDAATLSGTIDAVGAATVADVFVVPALGGDEEGLAGWAVVEATAAGVTVGVEEAKLGLNGSGLATLQLDGVEVAEQALFATGTAGEALLEQGSDWLRIAYAAACVGVATAALEAARSRVSAADGELGSAQSVQWMLADSATESEAARLLTWYAASRNAAGELREAAAMARLVAADTAVKSTRRTLQICGREGSSRAAGVERLYRDAKALEVHHGASEAQRLAVARRLLPDLVDAADAR